ncbi:MAG: hypothetical protein HRU17_14385 [Polyangiaceae bacterium]|nr:hypothetical protein [Polyangiaceae bacterium]
MISTRWIGTFLLGALALGCGKSGEEENPNTAANYQQGQPGPGGQAPPPGQQQPGAQPGPAGYPAASAQPAPGPGGQPGAPPAAGAQPAAGQPMAPLGAIMANPAGLQGIIAGALSGGAAAVGALSGGELGMMEAGIKMQAGIQAKGMTAEGQLMSAKLQQGAHAEGHFTMQPGVCYTIIGFGLPGVFDYQINLITDPPMPPQVLAQSAVGGVNPVVGANEACIRNPFPLPMSVKVDMNLLRGTGMVGAQVYKK